MKGNGNVNDPGSSNVSDVLFRLHSIISKSHTRPSAITYAARRGSEGRRWASSAPMAAVAWAQMSVADEHAE